MDKNVPSHEEQRGFLTVVGRGGDPEVQLSDCHWHLVPGMTGGWRSCTQVLGGLEWRVLNLCLFNFFP